MIVTIDGPAGAGKSTVARLLAERLGASYVDTGAMYRALAWLALERGEALDDGPGLALLAEREPIELANGRVELRGRDVTRAIREARVERVVSTVASHGEVRAVMRARQRALAEAGDSVLEGRDTGTAVCPHADVKVYLVADSQVRAARRQDERPEADLEATETDLRLRDERDADQMQMAADATLIDTSDLTVDEVVERIEALVRTHAATGAGSGG